MTREIWGGTKIEGHGGINLPVKDDIRGDGGSAF